MKVQLLGDSDCPMARIALARGEQVRIEAGSMAYMKNVSIEGHMNAKSGGIKGAFSAIGRMLTSGENFFITTATGMSDDGEIGIAPPIPGKIVKLRVGGTNQYCLNTNVYLASDMSAGYNMVQQRLSKAFFGGTGGLYIMQTYGEGSVLATAFGDLLPIDVTPECPIRIDNEHVVAWDAALQYDIRVASGTFGFKTGEGLVNEFHGLGRVYIQTRNMRDLAQALYPYLPHPSGN